MQNLLKKDSGLGSMQSESQLSVGCSLWENSTESHAQQSSISKSLSLKMGVLSQHLHNTKQLSFHFQDQDSSSTQSTGQSHPEMAGMKGYNGSQEKPMVGHVKQVSSTGTQDFMFPSQLDFNQPIAHIPFYAESYFGGLLAAASYGPQTMIHHSQMVGMAPRVPLPLDLTEDEPIYVNAKQYRAILRRRQFRAKLEAQNKVVKARKPYLHESRHLHALKRARGSGGRFLNTKDVQASNTNPTGNEMNGSGSAQLCLRGDKMESKSHQQENQKDGSSTTSCSDVTSGSNSDDIFQQEEFRFPGYPMHTHLVGSHGGGNQHHISALF